MSPLCLSSCTLGIRNTEFYTRLIDLSAVKMFQPVFSGRVEFPCGRAEKGHHPVRVTGGTPSQDLVAPVAGPRGGVGLRDHLKSDIRL